MLIDILVALLNDMERRWQEWQNLGATSMENRRPFRDAPILHVGSDPEDAGTCQSCPVHW